MKKTKLKMWLMSILFLFVIMLSTTIFGANENIQIFQESDNEYMIYISGHLDESFEFAFSNEKDVVKEESYKISLVDSSENNVAYVDENLYTTFFNQTTYMWARTLEGEYFVEAIEIDLSNYTTQNDVDCANNITKIIEVNTQNTLTTVEMQGDVEVTKTVGKVEVLEEGTTYYQLVKLPSTESYDEFVKIAQKISNNKVEDNMYAKLEATKEFSKLYKQLAPEITDTNWVKVENANILQPEEAKQDEQYVLWLKTEKDTGTKMDAQFLTCFADYEPKVISEKVTTKLPVTYDNPILFIILAILIVAFVIVLALRIMTNKKQAKH